MESVPPINRFLSHGHWTMGFMGSWIRGPENLRSRHFGIGADAPAGCHGGKFAAAGIFGLDQVHHQGLLRGPVCHDLARDVVIRMLGDFDEIPSGYDIHSLPWKISMLLSSVNLYFYGPFPMATLNSQRVFKTFKVLTQHLGCTKTADFFAFWSSQNRDWSSQDLDVNERVGDMPKLAVWRWNECGFKHRKLRRPWKMGSWPCQIGKFTYLNKWGSEWYCSKPFDDYSWWNSVARWNGPTKQHDGSLRRWSLRKLCEIWLVIFGEHIWCQEWGP